MPCYPYRPELPAPADWTGIDFLAPQTARSMDVLVRTLRQASLTFSPPAGVLFSDRTVTGFDGAALRCYCLEPEETKDAVPGMLYCHGGGFFLPVQPMMLQLAAQYAKALGIRVYLPEYRLLPQYANPYPFRDCLSVWQWLRTEAQALKLDPDRLLLYGESVGGLLAAGLALWQREQPGPPAVGQCLIYPALDRRFSRYPSMRRYSEAAWPLKNHLNMWQLYLRDGTAGLDRWLIPMLCEDVSGLPAAYIEAEELDILHDEALAYAGRLRTSGVPAQLAEIPGSYHGFDSHTDNPFVQSVVRQRIAAMKQMIEERGRNP